MSMQRQPWLPDGILALGHGLVIQADDGADGQVARAAGPVRQLDGAVEKALISVR